MVLLGRDGRKLEKIKTKAEIAADKERAKQKELFKKGLKSKDISLKDVELLVESTKNIQGAVAQITKGELDLMNSAIQGRQEACHKENQEQIRTILDELSKTVIHTNTVELTKHMAKVKKAVAEYVQIEAQKQMKDMEGRIMAAIVEIVTKVVDKARDDK